MNCAAHFWCEQEAAILHADSRTAQTELQKNAGRPANDVTMPKADHNPCFRVCLSIGYPVHGAEQKWLSLSHRCLSLLAGSSLRGET